MSEDPNPARLEQFDYQPVTLLPEYAAAAKALDDLLRALNEKGMAPHGQDGWLRLVRDITTAIPFSDCCGRCNSQVYICGVVPGAVEIENGRVRAVYTCPECRHRWTCSWSLTYPNHH